MPTTPEEPELTPDQEAEVRRLLAGARHREPTPEAVVARLDRVLADLAGEPVREAAVIRLADRRRRATTLLVAAAAVIAVGIGVGQVLPQAGEDASPNSATADAETDGQAESGATAPDVDSQAGGAGAESAEDLSGAAPVTVRDEQFARDAARIQDAYRSFFLTDGTQSYSDKRELNRRGAARFGASCERGDWGDGRYVPVVYERSPGWLVLRFAQGETQVADLFVCGSELAVRSVTLPFP